MNSPTLNNKGLRKIQAVRGSMTTSSTTSHFIHEDLRFLCTRHYPFQRICAVASPHSALKPRAAVKRQPEVLAASSTARKLRTRQLSMPICQIESAKRRKFRPPHIRINSWHSRTTLAHWQPPADQSLFLLLTWAGDIFTSGAFKTPTSPKRQWNAGS